jgi:alpha-L-rhamnosidase
MKRKKLISLALMLTALSAGRLSAQTQPVFEGCRWIGGGNEDLPLYSPYLSVFKISYTLQILPQGEGERSGAAKAGFIYGANDERLMNKYKNIYHLQSKRDSSYIMLELELPEATGEDGACALLHIYRAGYAPEDKAEVPLKTVAIPHSIINGENKLLPHTFYVHSNSGITQIYVDGEGRENLVADVSLNLRGRGGNFFAFPVLADIGYYIPQNQPATFSNIEIRSFGSPSNILHRYEFPQPLRLDFHQREGRRITFDPSRNAMPLLRTVFSAGRHVEKAELHVTARGIYVPYLNGQRVGKDYFNPGHTQYTKTLLYQTYDVSGFLREGKNELRVQLGEGWWSGAATYATENWNLYGDRNSLLAKLVITYADGKQEVVATDPATWEYSAQSHVVHSSLFNGEVHDARQAAPQWKPAAEVALEGNVNERLDFANAEAIPQIGQPVQPFDTLTAAAVEEVRPNVFVYDMGQNMVGVPRIVFADARAGQRITLRYAEVTYPDLPEYKGLAGELMLENLREVMAQDVYVSGGAQGEVFQPLFTFHGYRYVEITGIDKPLPTSAVQGVVLSSVGKFTARYECSNPKVNRLWENIRWSMLGNFVSIPTDCPQRNERLGWSGDLSVFARTATYLADVAPFLQQHLRAMRDTQRENGRFADVAPEGSGLGFGGLLWGSAGVTVAGEMLRQYGDTAALAQHYPAMKRYVDFVLEKCIDKKSNVLVQEDPDAWGNLGDWLGPEQVKNDNSLLWEAYFLFDLEIMKSVSAALGNAADAKFFAEVYEQRKAFFNETYIDRETQKTVCSGVGVNGKHFPKGKVMDTQTSYALPLAFGIVQEEYRAAFVENFVKTIERENVMDDGKLAPPYSLLTGFIGTAWISKALSENGHSRAAYRLLQQTSYPSWLYPVEQGATTIWERLNSYTREAGFGGNNSMNSFNHYSFGAVGAWLMENSLGICVDARRYAAGEGALPFVLAPEPDPTGEMTFARGHYDLPCGRIESGWEIAASETRYRFVVPTGARATLYLSGDKITFAGNKNVRQAGKVGGKQRFELLSGEHNVIVKHK